MACSVVVGDGACVFLVTCEVVVVSSSVAATTASAFVCRTMCTAVSRLALDDLARRTNELYRVLIVFLVEYVPMQNIQKCAITKFPDVCPPILPWESFHRQMMFWCNS